MLAERSHTHYFTEQLERDYGQFWWHEPEGNSSSWNLCLWFWETLGYPAESYNSLHKRYKQIHESITLDICLTCFLERKKKKYLTIFIVLIFGLVVKFKCLICSFVCYALVWIDLFIYFLGYDVIAQAQSGTGKTATFAISILQQLEIEQKETQALVLAPTRELAQQVCCTWGHHKLKCLSDQGGIFWQ